MFIRVFLYPATLPLQLTTLHYFILSVVLINVIAYIIVISIVMVPQEQHAGAIFASQRSPVLGSPFIRAVVITYMYYELAGKYNAVTLAEIICRLNDPVISEFNKSPDVSALLVSLFCDLSEDVKSPCI